MLYCLLFVHQKFHLGNFWNDQLPLILKGPYYRCLIAGVEFLSSVLLRRWAGVAGWTNNKNKTKIWEKENEWAEEKWFEETKTETKIKRSFYHKVWAKHGSVITCLWLCSALSHRLPLPVGLNSTDLWGRETTQSTGWSLISLIITAAKKLQQESTELMERKYLWTLFYLFLLSLQEQRTYFSLCCGILKCLFLNIIQPWSHWSLNNDQRTPPMCLTLQQTCGGL